MENLSIVPFESIKGDLFVPSIQLGIKIGIAKYTKTNGHIKIKTKIEVKLSKKNDEFFVLYRI